LKLREQKSIAQFVKVFVRTNQHRLQDKQYHAGVSIQMDLPTSDTPTIIKYALKGLELIYKEDHNYSKCGIELHGLIPENTIQIESV